MTLTSSIPTTRAPATACHTTGQHLQRVDTAAVRDTYDLLRPALAYEALLGPGLAQAELQDLRAQKLLRKHDRKGTCEQVISLVNAKAPEVPALASFTGDAWRASWLTPQAENLRSQLRECAGVAPDAACFEEVLLGFRPGDASPPHQHGAALACSCTAAKGGKFGPMHLRLASP